MSWSPNPTVVIGGRDYTGETVGRVAFRRGRPDVDASPSAASASVTLRDVDPVSLPVKVGQQLEVFVDSSAGSAIRVFGGQVQDLSVSTVATGNGQAVVVWQVSASGPIARLNRRQVLFTGRPQEDDGARVAAAVAAGLAQSWEEYQGSSWSEEPNSWESVDPAYDASLIDPGVYDLVALGTADGGYSALSVAQDAAFSARGILYETRDGFIGYADANRRQSAGTGVFLEIPTSVIAESGLGFRQQLTSLVNRVTVTYDGGAYTASDLDSIREYGLWASEFDTQLAVASAGSAVATEFVLDRSAPAYELDEVEVILNQAGTALLDALLIVEPNDAVQVTGMPSGLPVDTLLGFVESIGMSVDPYTARMTFGISDASLSIGAVRWSGVGTAVTWTSLGTGLVWAAARSL